MRAAALLVAALAALSPAEAQYLRPPDNVLAAAGGYLLAAEEGARRCMLLLRAVPVQGGMALGFPAHCRIALPILGEAVAWSVEPAPAPLHGRIRFHDSQGASLVEFNTDGPGEGVSGADRTGLRYRLEPGDGRSLAVRFGAAPVARTRAASAAARPAGPVVEPAANDQTAMARVAGDYALLRGKDRPTGCRLSLSAPAGPGPAPAALAAGCADKGVAFFAPTRWSLVSGTLWLLNARGQKLSFDRNRQNAWEKSAGQGEPLTMIRP